MMKMKQKSEFTSKLLKLAALIETYIFSSTICVYEYRKDPSDGL